MKQKEVTIGMNVFTYIGEELAEVIVCRHVPGFGNSRDTFVVRRVNETRELPSRRTAASLRKTNEKLF